MPNFTLKISSMYGNPGPLSLLPSGLGIEGRDPIREVSVIFGFPIFPPIYGLQIFIEMQPWLSKDRKRLFEIVSLLFLPHRLAFLAPTLKQRPAAAAMHGQFGAPPLPSRAQHLWARWRAAISQCPTPCTIFCAIRSAILSAILSAMLNAIPSAIPQFLLESY